MASQHLLHIAKVNLCDAHEQEQIDSSATSAHRATIVRRDAEYQPSHWNYERIQSIPIDSQEEDEKRGERIGKLKCEVAYLLVTEKDIFEQLEVVDALVQLGVGYHFEKEVHDVLSGMQGVIDDLISERPNDLHAISQLFRVLRNSGFDVSQDIFKGYREDGKGGFKSSLCLDHKGMLSLYEASFLGMVDEDTMDEAREFTTKHLRELLLALEQQGPNSDARLKLRVAYALEHPIHWRITRYHARWFIDAYGEMDCMNPRILELAKLDYNAVQNMYKKEVKHLSRWWNDISPVREDSSYFRCRLMECFFWAIGLMPEPKFGRSRSAHTRVITIITFLDDCYDVYGTPDELELLAEAIKRWDATLIKELPQCMQLTFLAMLNTINQLGYEILRDKDVDVTPLLKESYVILSDAYHQEAKWYHSGYMPSMEEYMNNASISATGITLTAVSLCASEQITKDAVQSFQPSADGIRYTSTIVRLLDDLVSATPHLGDVPKALHCLMSENGGSEALARERIRQMIIENWKQLNAYPIPHPISLDTCRAFLFSFPRICHITYEDGGDAYGRPTHKSNKRIQSVLVDPVPL